jgi:hypothetical protein
MIDALPTGSLFSFLWNMLVSISFQFVGFLLTYLLHTTHAAKLGSRAGLGITLIQYGFAMRGRAEEWNKEQQGDADGWGWQSTTGQNAPPLPTFATAAEAEDYFNKLAANGTAWPSSVSAGTPLQTSGFLGDATTEWLSFFLMTVGQCLLHRVRSLVLTSLAVGWFILLTSLLSFWRVKRWERGILQSTPSSSLPAPGTSTSTSPSTGLLGRFNLLRTGLGFQPQRSTPEGIDSVAGEYPGALHHFGDGPQDEVDDGRERNAYIIPIDESNPEATDRLARAYAEEARLQRALRAAGLL